MSLGGAETPGKVSRGGAGGGWSLASGTVEGTGQARRQLGDQKQEGLLVTWARCC